jgi:EF hand domain-containing protein
MRPTNALRVIRLWRNCRRVSHALSDSPTRILTEALMPFSTNRRTLLAGASSTFIGLSLDPVFAASKAKMKYDTDNDGTLDLNEVKSAAGAAFDKLDRDKDGTLDKKELGARISKDMMGDADPDKDGTVSKDEYVGLAEKLFKAADTDNEGTLDAKELRSKAGQQLMKLLK